MNFKTLKFRINMMTVIYSVIIIVISSWIMFTIVSNLIGKRIEEENSAFIHQVKNSLENDFSNLNNISILFTPYGNLGESLIQFNQMENVGDKSIMMSKIKADMGVISFSNRDVVLCTFFFNEKYTDYIGTTSSIDSVDFSKLPVMFMSHQNTFYGPHPTAKVVDESLVISVKSEVDIGSEQNTFVYVETSFDEIQTMLEGRDQDGYDYMILDQNDHIIFNTDRQNKAMTFDEIIASNRELIQYEAVSEQGWKIISVVNPSTIKSLEMGLIYKNLAIYPFFLVPGIIFSLIIINIIARPLQRFQEGVIQMEEGDFDTLIPKTDIMEFDILIERIHKAKLMISMLMDEVREKEKKRAFAEISRLRAQINPHFILNTLNSVHWMAIKNQQPAIDNIVLSLTKILSYNLRNKEYTATIGEELAATEEYLKLQQLKYDLSYQVDSNLGDDGLEHEMPRFILQPLVENSILHGKEEMIEIWIQACYRDEGIELSVRDHGGKINEETLKYVNDHKEKPQKLGIGLSYVFSALEAYYHRDDLIIFEDAGDGVSIRIFLPLEGGMENV